MDCAILEASPKVLGDALLPRISPIMCFSVPILCTELKNSFCAICPREFCKISKPSLCLANLSSVL